MLRELFLLTKQPYASGIIATQWVGTLILYAIDSQMPIIRMVMLNMLVSFIIATYGFRSGK